MWGDFYFSDVVNLFFGLIYLNFSQIFLSDSQTLDAWIFMRNYSTYMQK